MDGTVKPTADKFSMIIFPVHFPTRDLQRRLGVLKQESQPSLPHKRVAIKLGKEQNQLGRACGL